MAGRDQTIQAGIAALQRGALDDAAESFGTVLKRAPRDAVALMYMALTEQSRGALEKARVLMAKAARYRSSDPRLLNNYAQLLMALGEPENAEAQARLAVELNDTFADGWNNLGLALAAQKRDDAAVESLERAVALAPGDAKIRFNLGWALAEAGRVDDAADALGHAIRLAPDIAKIRLVSGDVDVQRGALESALRQYKEAERLAPRVPAIRQRQGMAYRRMGRLDDAVDRFRSALEIDPENPASRLDLAQVLLQTGQTDEAAENFRKAGRRSGDHPPLLAQAAIGLGEAGDTDGARALIEDGSARFANDPDLALAHGALAENTPAASGARAVVERALADAPELGSGQRRSLLFVLARLEDQCDEVDSAFRHLHEANGLRGARFDRDVFDSLIERIITAFSAEALRGQVRAENRDDHPVLIAGMQRSGVGALGRLLSAHPSVSDLSGRAELTATATELGAGPFGYLGRLETIDAKSADDAAAHYLERTRRGSGDALRIVEANPANLLHLGLAHMILPSAQTILCRRDLVECCLSCYFQDFSGALSYAYDLDDLAHVALAYTRLEKHWEQVLDTPPKVVEFEALMRDPSATARLLAPLLGLPAVETWPPAGETAGFRSQTSGLGSGESKGNPPAARSRRQRYGAHIGRLVDRLGIS